MLHVLVGATCNNNCIFCMESDRGRRRTHILSQSADDIRRMIESYPEKTEILFTSGEPTLAPRLPDYITSAHTAGYRTIALISNGRRLSYPEYTRHLIECGLNKITVSIHGHRPEIHDSLTRTGGSFLQTVRGLENLAREKRRRPLDLHSSTVVVGRNLPYLVDIYEFLRDKSVDRMVFNVLMLKGRGLDHIGTLMPTYRQIASKLHELAQRISAADRQRVTVADIPRCTALGLPFDIVGDQERFSQFEPSQSLGVEGLSMEDLRRMQAEGSNKMLQASLLDVVSEGEGCLEEDSEYYLTTRELKDGLMRTKRPLCSTCIHEPGCPGVWEGYTARYGWDEFISVQADGPPGEKTNQKQRATNLPKELSSTVGTPTAGAEPRSKSEK